MKYLSDLKRELPLSNLQIHANKALYLATRPSVFVCIAKNMFSITQSLCVHVEERMCIHTLTEKDIF